MKFSQTLLCKQTPGSVKSLAAYIDQAWSKQTKGAELMKEAALERVIHLGLIVQNTTGGMKD